MGNPNDGALARLQADWPRWQVWIVHRVVGGPVWCARRHDDHKKVINAGSAAELAGYLTDEAGPSAPACGRCGRPKPDDGNDWCKPCEDEHAAEVLAALREHEDDEDEAPR